MSHTRLLSQNLTNSQKHLALDIMKWDYDYIPREYRDPLTRALKYNYCVNPEIIKWLLHTEVVMKVDKFFDGAEEIHIHIGD